MNLYIYNKASKKYLRKESGSPTWIVNDINENEGFTLVKPPNSTQTWKWVDTEWVELLPINNPDIPYSDEYIWDNNLGQWVESPELVAYNHLELQEEVWEDIKRKRLEMVESGVYIPSLDKKVHTDSDTAAMYAQIGSSILLGTFEEMNWKAMDNTFFNMTENVFKDIQTEMMRQTQHYYAKAEYHKVMMLAANDPLEYNYHDDW